MGALVWLFREHRELWLENQRLQRVIRDLEYQLSAPNAGTNALIKQYQEETLVDLPFEGGKIPDNMWLTPGLEEKPDAVR